MTLKDVALKANCSVATVSKALKNSSEISMEAKQRILEVAKECGYFKKATTRSAVLGGVKTVIFNDVKGNSAELYFDIQKLAKKSGLTAIYLSVSVNESLELLNQLGAFGIIIKGGKVAEDSKVFALQTSADEAKEFLKDISSFMPQRPSRAANGKTKKVANQNKPKQSSVKKAVKKEPVVQKKEEIWLL